MLFANARDLDHLDRTVRRCPANTRYKEGTHLMRQHKRAFGLAAAAAALSACGAAHATDISTSTAPATGAPATTTAPSDTMPATQDASAPSPAALMICGSEIRHNVATLLALPAAPRTSTTWVDNVYTCTYHLAQGPLVLSVHEPGNAPTARGYFVALRTRLGTTRPLRGAKGLGLPAYETTGGNVAFLKDDTTLQVNATRLPQYVERSHRTRADLAYTLATDIMGCWSGD